jgi:hypothetical protein
MRFMSKIEMHRGSSHKILQKKNFDEFLILNSPTIINTLWERERAIG